jgi:hypothetical protein
MDESQNARNSNAVLSARISANQSDASNWQLCRDEDFVCYKCANLILMGIRMYLKKLTLLYPKMYLLIRVFQKSQVLIFTCYCTDAIPILFSAPQGQQRNLHCMRSCAMISSVKRNIR